jgi:hypothetical protein
MSLLSWAFGSQSSLSDSELPEIFPLSLDKQIFIKSDILTTYLKILTDTIERTHGLPEKFHPLLWDNCLQSESNTGLISLLACAMTDKKDLFLVYKGSVNVLRIADSTEQEQIKRDYEKTGKSSVGIFVSFKNYFRTDMLEIYSALEYCVLCSLHKTLNVSKAVQIKISELRSSVSLADASIASTQAKSIANALRNGRDTYLDAKDIIETAKIDTSSTEKAILFLDGKRAFILGLPLAYISGEQTTGIGTTGEADAKAVERGLKQYFVSIIQPVLKALFGADTEFKTEDFRGMTTALEVLKTFELVSDENLSQESKQEIIARVFDLDPDEEQKNLKSEAAQRDANPPPDQNQQDPNQNQNSGQQQNGKQGTQTQG